VAVAVEEGIAVVVVLVLAPEGVVGVGFEAAAAVESGFEACGLNPRVERRDVRSGVIVFSTLASSAWMAAFMPDSVRRSGPV
jgi:hypothetical protein